MRTNTIFFYGIPAYGHVLSNVYLAKRLSGEGFQVIYYSLEPFQKVIEANGCEYRPYPLDWETLDLSDGERILKLYRLILQYTQEMLPGLLKDARKVHPRAVIFESLALWGRAVGTLLSLPSFSFYSIAAIDWAGKKGLAAYANGFLWGFLRYAGELPRALQLKAQLDHKYGLTKLGLLPVLMNKGDYNLCGYSRLFQPEGKRFGVKYRFLGPLSVHRTVVETNDFPCPTKPFLYISLGTIFNRNKKLLEAILEQFGSGNQRTTKDNCGSGKWDYQVILVWSGKAIEKNGALPDNFIVRPFVNQNEILKRASLFVTAGGVNSIHEALYYGVPCLLCPQQGEQFLNARRFEKLGFGRILRNMSNLRQEAEKCMKLKGQWSEERRRRMLRVSTKGTMELFRRLAEENSDTKNSEKDGYF